MSPLSRRSALALLGSGLAGLAGCSDQSRDEGVPVPEKATRPSTDDPPTLEPTERKEPSRAGHEAVRWWADLGEELSTGIATRDGSVFVATAPDEFRIGTPTTPVDAFRIRALDAGDGTTRWTVETHAPPRRSLAVTDERLYVSCGFSTGYSGTNYRVYALDAADGKVRWQHDPAIDKFVNVLDVTANTVYAGTSDDAIGQDGEYVLAVDAATGEERWRVGSGDAYRGVATDDAVFVPTVGGLRALESDSGEERWRYEASKDGSRPTVRDDAVFAEDDEGIVALSTADGETRWRFAPEERYEAGWQVNDDAVYVRTSEGRLHALDADTGEERWRMSSNYGGRGLAVADSAVLIDGEHALTSLDSRIGDERWRYENDGDLGRIWATVGTVYATDRDRMALVALDATDGTVRWAFDLGDERVRLTVTETGAYLGTSEGVLYALE